MAGSGCSGLPWQLKALMVKPVIVQLLLELFQFFLVVQHRELAMRIARIIAGTQLDRVDIQLLQLFKDFIQGKLRQ